LSSMCIHRPAHRSGRYRGVGTKSPERAGTPQSYGFRDHAAQLAAYDARVPGVSSQPLAEQEAFAERTRMPFPIISDEQFMLAAGLSLPTFEFDGRRFYKRIALIAEKGWWRTSPCSRPTGTLWRSSTG
jgi:peroxiredoxin